MSLTRDERIKIAKALGPKAMLNVQMHNDRRVKTGGGIKIGAGIFSTIGKFLLPVAKTVGRDIIIPALAKLARSKLGGGIITTNKRLPAPIALKLLGELTPAQLKLVASKSKVGGGIFQDIARTVGPTLLKAALGPGAGGIASSLLLGRGLKRAGKNKQRGEGLKRAGKNKQRQGAGPRARKKKPPVFTIF